MFELLLEWVEAVFRTLSQILMAGVAVTAFSLLLYALAFNLRDRVARSFAGIMICVVISFTAVSLVSTNSDGGITRFLLLLQWAGVILLPPIYLQFSNAVLATTGKPSKGKRLIAISLAYLISGAFLILLLLGWFVGPVVYDNVPVPHLTPITATYLFALYFMAAMAASWINFVRSYRRAVTSTSRRRMGYLIAGAVAPVIGSLPFLLFGSGIVRINGLVFWGLTGLSNTIVIILIVIMSYAVAFFGTPWPDRVVKGRLFKWLMRGPFTASATLGVVTVIRRAGALFGQDYTALVPIFMVATILLLEYVIVLFAPLGERYLFWGKDSNELQIIHNMEDRLLTNNDLRQFLEMILSAVCDRLQVKGAYIAVLTPDGFEQLASVGITNAALLELPGSEEVQPDRDEPEAALVWKNSLIIPLQEQENGRNLIGLLGIPDCNERVLETDEWSTIEILKERAVLALRDRRLQEDIFANIQEYAPDIAVIEHLRASARYGNTSALSRELPEAADDVIKWVRDALTHYWGGPRLTETPLMKFKVVQLAVDENEGNQANAMRSVIKKAVERIRPEGERRYTADWILYNIIELKFLEGKKVREVALRLSMSEADLYRKQRIAIEAVAREILEMESQVLNPVRPASSD